MFKAIIIQTDMDKDKTEFALKTVEQQFSMFGKTSLMSKGIKESMDAKFGPDHNVVFGDGFGACFTHADGGYAKISLDKQLTILIFKV